LFFNVENLNTKKSTFLDDFLKELSEKQLQNNARKPEDFIFRIQFDKEIYAKLQSNFPDDAKKLDSHINSFKSKNLSSNPVAQENSAIFKCAKEFFGRKDVQLGLKIASAVSNFPRFGMMLAVNGVLNSKKFKNMKEKSTNRIKETLDNSESFQKFKSNNPWIDKLKKSKAFKYTSLVAGVGLVAAATAIGLASTSDAIDKIGDMLVVAASDNPETLSNTLDSHAEPVNQHFPNEINGINNSEVQNNNKELHTPQKDVEQNNAINNNHEQQTNQNQVPPVSSYTLGSSIEIPDWKNGGTLSQIAQNALGENATNADIQNFITKTAELNNISNPDYIQKGATLNIPTQEQLNLKIDSTNENNSSNTNQNIDLKNDTISKNNSSVIINETTELAQQQTNKVISDLDNNLANKFSNTATHEVTEVASVTQVVNNDSPFEETSVDNGYTSHSGVKYEGSGINLETENNGRTLEVELNEKSLQENFHKFVALDAVPNAQDFINISIESLGSSAILNASTLSTEDLNIFTEKMASQIATETGFEFKDLSDDIKKSILENNGVFNTANLDHVKIFDGNNANDVNFDEIIYQPKIPNVEMNLEYDIQKDFSVLLNSGIEADQTKFVDYVINEIGLDNEIDFSDLSIQQQSQIADQIADRLSSENEIRTMGLNTAITTSIAENNGVFSLDNIGDFYVFENVDDKYINTISVNANELNDLNENDFIHSDDNSALFSGNPDLMTQEKLASISSKDISIDEIKLQGSQVLVEMNEQDLANNFSRLIEHDLIANTDDLIKHTVEKLGSNVPLDLSGLNEGQLNLFCDEMADKISDENGNTLKFNNLSEAIKSGITNSNGVFSTDNIQSVDVLHNGEIEHVNFVNINHTPSTPNLDMKFNMDIQNRFTSIVESGIFNDNTDFIIHSISELGMTANLDVSTLNNQELDLFAKTMAEQISIETGMSFNNLEESIKESILHHDNTFSMGNLNSVSFNEPHENNKGNYYTIEKKDFNLAEATSDKSEHKQAAKPSHKFR
jgi:hypothetical protein